MTDKTNSEPRPDEARQNASSVISSYVCGIGGFPKLVMPILDALYRSRWGERPEIFPMTLLDFDAAPGQVAVGDTTYTTETYQHLLSKKAVLDISRRLRRRDRKVLAALEPFRPYVDLDAVKAVDAPGLNLYMQAANLAWRMVHTADVVPELSTRLAQLNPSLNTRVRLQRQGLSVADRSMIWVIAGGASTTGPSGLIPILAELKRRKPAHTSLFGVLFTPRAYREETAQRQIKGRAIFRATMTQLAALYDGDAELDQPYGLTGYRLRLDEPPFDHLFLVDGSHGGGQREFQPDQIANLVAQFIFKLTTGACGQNLLSAMGDLNRNAEAKNDQSVRPPL